VPQSGRLRVEDTVQELKQVSEGFVVSLLKAALPPYRIDLRKVRLVLKLAVASGHDPVLVYQKALEGRPERWEKPPLADEVVNASVTEAPPSESLEEVRETVAKLRGSSDESPPSTKSTER
jgi:hypothetical protein